jgi:Uma2 family endonuclease
MATTTTPLTVDEFERLPYEQTQNCELVDGELVPVSGNDLEHNEIRDLLIEVSRPFARKEGLGKILSEQEYDFDGNVHAPDVSFFGADKLPLADRKKRVQRFVPDLAIEIVSPNDSFEYLIQKKDRYRTSGVREVWILSPVGREVFVFSDRGDRILHEDEELTTELLPGLKLRVGELFQAD